MGKLRIKDHGLEFVGKVSDFREYLDEYNKNPDEYDEIWEGKKKRKEFKI